MLSKVRQLKYLSDIYKELFGLIEKYRPVFNDILAQLWREIEAMEFQIDSYAQRGLSMIYGTMKFTQDAYKRLKPIHERGAMDDRLYFHLIYSLWKIAYLYGNSWYILIDGVIFEGVFEEESQKMLQRISSQLPDTSLLDLLEMCDCLTAYQYLGVAQDQAQKAKQQYKAIITHLRQHGAEAEGQLLQKFIELYSRFKYWQEQFNQAWETALEPILPILWDEMLALLRQFGFSMNGELALPWNLMPYIDEHVLPQLLAISTTISDKKDYNS